MDISSEVSGWSVRHKFKILPNRFLGGLEEISVSQAQYPQLIILLKY